MIAQGVRKIITFLGAVLGLSGQPADARTMEMKTFMDIVQTSPVSEVAIALRQQPALAIEQDQWDFSAVHVLDDIDSDEKLELLQRYGVDVNAQNDQGHALLRVIIDPELIAVVVAAGADVNLQDFKGQTPLMVHLQEPDGWDFVPAFLDAGANLALRDNSGASVLHYAAYFGDPVLTRILTDAGAKP